MGKFWVGDNQWIATWGAKSFPLTCHHKGQFQILSGPTNFLMMLTILPTHPASPASILRLLKKQ